VRTKVTLVLVFLNVALFFFIFQFERPWRVQESLRDARRRVLGPEAADIRSLDITTPAGTTRLERRGDAWWVAKPQDWPANDHAVRSILNELQLLEDITHFAAKDLTANSQSLADYGLEQPKLTVTFTSGSQLSTTLRIGDATKIGNRLYILSPAGDRIHVVARGLADALSLPLDQVRTDSLLNIQFFETRALSVQTPTVRVRIRREAGNRWLFDTIINNARASRNAIDTTIGALNGLKVKTFSPATPPAILPSAAPALRVTIEGNNRRETLLLGEPVPVSQSSTPNSQLSTLSSQPAAGAAPAEYYAQLEGRPALFTVVVSADLMQTLRNAQVSLRETHLLDFDARTVTSVALSAPNQSPLTLQRLESAAGSPDAAWQIVRRSAAATGPQTQSADRDAVQRLLQQLTNLAAKNFVSDAPTNADLENWGFNRPEREITLTLAPAAPTPAPALNSPPTTIALHLGTDSAGALFARLDPATNPKGSVYAVTLDLARELSVIPRDWRDRTLPALPATARLTAIKLTSLPDNATLLAIALDDAGNPKAEIKHPKALAPVVAQLRTPRAKRFIQDAFSERVTTAGDDRPWKLKLEATVSLPGGAGGEQTSTRTLFFTDRVGGAQQLAGSQEFDAVFEIEQPVLDALWTLAYGPRDPGAK
jgi:hypothetical protein